MKIYGAGGHGRVVIEIAELCDKVDLCYIDDLRAGSFAGYPVLHSSALQLGDEMIVAIGDNSLRRAIVNKYEFVKYMTLLHPSSNLSKSASLGYGTVCMAGISINAATTIGHHCVINTNSSIDHDCVIGDFVHISPNAALGGGVTVGEGAHIGIGSSIKQGVKIGKWAVVGAGAAVIRDVPDFAVVVGVPGRVIKYNIKDEK